MVTILTTPNGNPDGGNGAAGWVVAFLAVLLLGLFGVWFFTMEDRQSPESMESASEEEGDALIPPPMNIFNTTVNSTTTIEASSTNDQ